MCGRYTAKWEPVAFQHHFNVQPSPFESYNLAPTQHAPIIRLEGGDREALEARWGLIPRWVDKPFDFKANLFNARAETLLEKASFKRPFKSQRCLVPASGFYEWKKVGTEKQPYHIRTKDNMPIASAGLYDFWSKDDMELLSYTIITTTPNKLMQELHDRMPVILKREDYEAWLEPENDPEALMDLLKPFEGELEAYKVDKRVGRVRENDVGLLGKRDVTPVSEEPKA